MANLPILDLTHVRKKKLNKKEKVDFFIRLKEMLDFYNSSNISSRASKASSIIS
jgi:hypothetical protein